MTWKCYACDTVNDDQHASCSVCELERSAAEVSPELRAPRPTEITHRGSPAPAPAPLPDRTGGIGGIAKLLAGAVAVLAVVVAVVSLSAGGSDTRSTSAVPSYTSRSESTSGAVEPSGDTESSSGASSGSGSGLETRRYSAFSIDVPADWRTVERDRDHDGAFFETKWRSPESSKVFALVDYTPGFSGTPEEAARGVRKNFPGLDGYTEHSFAPFGDGWRWIFSLDGTQKADYFYTRCDTGFAFLGAAPEEDFVRYAETFEDMASSLTC